MGHCFSMDYGCSDLPYRNRISRGNLQRGLQKLEVVLFSATVCQELGFSTEDDCLVLNIIRSENHHYISASLLLTGSACIYCFSCQRPVFAGISTLWDVWDLSQTVTYIFQPGQCKPIKLWLVNIPCGRRSVCETRPFQTCIPEFEYFRFSLIRQTQTGCIAIGAVSQSTLIVRVIVHLNKTTNSNFQCCWCWLEVLCCHVFRVGDAVFR